MLIIKASLVISLLMLLSGCSSNPSPSSSNCVCSSYANNQANIQPAIQPTWVGKELSDNHYLKSFGVAQCSGIEKIDLDEAASHARHNLALSISSHLQTQSHYRIQSGSSLVEGGFSGETETTSLSQINLNQSQLYDIYVNPETCVIYRAIRIPISEIHQQPNWPASLATQTFSIQTPLEYAPIVTDLIKQQIIDLRAQVIDPPKPSSYRIKVAITNKYPQAKQRLVSLSLSLEIINPNQQSIWLQSTRAKAVSLIHFDEQQLTKQAIDNALSNLLTPFRQALINHFKQPASIHKP